SYTNVPDILRFRCVCRFWRDVATHDSLWRLIFVKYFGNIPSGDHIFYQFVDIMQRIPRLSYAEPVISDVQRMEVGGGMTEIQHVTTDEILHMKVRCAPEKVNYRVQ